MIPKDQPDLRLHGTFFSLVILYLANLLVLVALFIIACPDVTWAGLGSDTAHHARRVLAAGRDAASRLPAAVRR